MILFWKSDEELEAITKRWFDLQERRGDVQVFRKRPAQAACDLTFRINGGRSGRPLPCGIRPDQPRCTVQFVRLYFCFFKVNR